MNRNKLFVITLPHIPFLAERKREIGVYAAGALFAVGWWMFIQACILSSKATPPPDAPYDTLPVRVAFADWVPGLLATFGMILVNLLDKEQLVDADDTSDTKWRARLVLFLGFACMAGGLAGSMAVLLLKYVLPDYQQSQFVLWGASVVFQNFCIMLSASVLWLAQQPEDGYEMTI